MTRSERLEDSPLWQSILVQLAGKGFEPWPAKRLFVRQRADALYDVVGLRMARGQVSEAAVFFAIWVPEMDALAADPAKNQRPSIKSFVSMPELSPVAPLKNSYWWPLALADAAERSSLQRQLGDLALPYFDSLATPADVLALLRARDDDGSREVAARMGERVGAPARQGDAPSILSRLKLCQ